MRRLIVFFNDTATTEIYTLSLHDALPISAELRGVLARAEEAGIARERVVLDPGIGFAKRTEHSLAVLRELPRIAALGDRKSTRLNSSHANISYAVFCLKKKNQYQLSLLSL